MSTDQINYSSKDEKMLVKHVKTITNSGLDVVDAVSWDNIKILMKKWPQLIGKAFDAMMVELRKPHSQVRYSAFLLCNEIFTKSHTFRTNVINKLEEILELTAEINPNKKLPLPKESATKLKTLSLETMLEWKRKFSDTYPALLEYYNFLYRCKNVDFDAVQRGLEARAAAKADEERERLRVRRLMFDSFIEEFSAKETEVEQLIQVINNCTELLIPTPDDFFVGNTDEVPPAREIENTEDFDPRLFGLRSSYNLEITINHGKKLRVDRSDENAAVVDNLRESVKVMKKRFVRVVDKWEDTVKKYSDDSSYIEKVADLKTRLSACLKKYEDLDIRGLDDSDDDSDMVEVVKENYEPDILPIVNEKTKPCEPSTSTAHIVPEKPVTLVPDWQDPVLLAQLKASTGIDLTMPQKRKKGERKKKPTLGQEVQETVRRRNFPGISRIVTSDTKTRLKKKLFSRSALKRVAESYKRH